MATAQDALDQFGGHAVAAGFELPLAKAALFRERLDAFFAGRAVVAEPRVWFYDAEASLDELSPQFMSWYEGLAPFGAQFSAPIFAVRRVRLTQAKELRGGHYRLTLCDGEIRRTALWFSPPKGHAGVDLVGRPGAVVDALVELQWNYFNGQKSLQFLVSDLRPTC